MNEGRNRAIVLQGGTVVDGTGAPRFVADVRIEGGRIAKVTPGPFITPDFSFALRASRGVWEKFWQPLPPLGFTDIFALVKQKLMRVEGDIHPFMANLLYFKDVLAAPRKEAAL